jgi:hypothetical protein
LFCLRTSLICLHIIMAVAYYLQIYSLAKH